MTFDAGKLNQAREWAEDVIAWPGVNVHARSAAEVILSLPGTIVDGEKLREVLDKWEDRAVDAADAPLFFKSVKALLPKPAPRAEITLGGWAMHPDHGKVLICSAQADEAGYVRAAWEFDAAQTGTVVGLVPADSLTPVPEDDTPETMHEETPEPRKVLTTGQDYEDAPVGTIVAVEWMAWAYVKVGENEWDLTGVDTAYTDRSMSRTSRTVLRWGWGEGEEA